jgi:hypothetical protein
MSDGIIQLNENTIKNEWKELLGRPPQNTVFTGQFPGHHVPAQKIIFQYLYVR